jgi:hypothetical protein
VPEELAKPYKTCEQKIIAFRREQDRFRAQFEREIASVRQQLDKGIAKVRQEQAKLGEGAAAPSKSHLGQPVQNVGLERELVDWKVQFAQAEQEIEKIWEHQRVEKSPCAAPRPDDQGEGKSQRPGSLRT